MRLNHSNVFARRRGFTVLEMLVAVGIIALIAAIMIPVVKSRLDKGEAAGIADNLRALRQGIIAYRDAVGRYPREIRQLQALPGSAGVSNQDICGATLSTAAISNWRGPYVAQLTPTGGIQVGNATIQNLFGRSPTDASTQADGYLLINVNNVIEPVFLDVDAAFDGGGGVLAGATIGAVQWNAASLVLTFYLALRNC